MTDDPARKCMDAALHLLKFRGRSVRDLDERLRKKNFAPDLVAPVLARLKELNLLNDETLARSWTESARRSGWGEQRLKQALWKRGVPRDIIVRILAEKLEEGAADEPSRAREALARRLKRTNTQELDRKALYRRLGGYLARQGFSPDVVRETLEHHLSSSPEE